MMDSVSWTAPPGAAQPVGIQSTAGAIPVVNEKGEVSMKKVKVQRYVSGKRPDYAPASSDDEFSDDDFTQPKAVAPPSPTAHKAFTDVEMQDPRLRRFMAMDSETQDEDRRNIRAIHQAEVIEMSEEEKDDDEGHVSDEEKLTEEPSRDDKLRISHRLADSDSESEGEVGDEELALRRLRLREKALSKSQGEEEILGKEDEGIEETTEDESSEYSEVSDSEEEGPRLKPIFVRQKDRVTIHQKETQHAKLRQIENEKRKRVDERRRETLRLIENENRLAASAVENGNLLSTDMKSVNTDDEADDAEYEAWKVRELKRLKRDKEEREAIEKEKEEIEKIHNMSEEERRLLLRNNQKTVTNKSIKGKYKFLQKYYHRGAFFLDKEDEVYKRDFSAATLEDHFDKTILPKVMQVKNFGRSGRTKYTHLVDQDTTSFDSPWASDTQMNIKFFNSNAGGMKQAFDRPTKQKVASEKATPNNATQNNSYQNRK